MEALIYIESIITLNSLMAKTIDLMVFKTFLSHYPGPNEHWIALD